MSGSSFGSTAAAIATRKDDVRETLHGVEVCDPYRWLEDQTSPETRAWIDAQNRHTRALLDPLPERAELTERLAQLMKVESVETVMPVGGRVYYRRRRPDQDQYVLCLRDERTGRDEV